MAVKDLKEGNFEEAVKSSPKVLVDFWASWCGPCQMQGPVVEELAEERNDIGVCKVNVDEEPSLAAKFQVTNIPSLVFFKEGRQVKKIIGFHSREEIEEILESL